MKTLNDKMDAREIVREAGMSNRPEYFSGLGARTCYLNDKQLEAIYQGIQREHGEKAAENFARMVADIPKLTATDFLLSLYTLEARNWKWKKSYLGNENGVDVGPDMGDGRREAIAQISVLNVFRGMSACDETPSIRGQFLKRHGVKNPDEREGHFYYGRCDFYKFGR